MRDGGSYRGRNSVDTEIYWRGKYAPPTGMKSLARLLGVEKRSTLTDGAVCVGVQLDPIPVNIAKLLGS